MIRNLELFSFIFIVLSLILAFIPLLKKKQINTVDDVSLLMNFISKGTKIVLKRFYNYLWVTAIVFITIIFSINIAIHVPAFRALLIIPALMTSVIMGWIGIQVSLSSIKGILGEAHLSLNTIMTSANQKSRLILTILISILLCDVLFWLIGLEYLISNNLFDIGSKLAANFNINWQSDLTNDATSDKIKNLILATSLSGYVLGSALHAVLARFNFSIFATSFDTASDLIGFSKYDFPEDDLRNPGSVPDLMGDQLKHNYLTITSFHSTSMVLIVGLSILGSFIGLIKPPTQSIDLVIYPLFFTAFGLFVTLGISLIVQAVPFIKTSFWKKACQQYLTALVLILTFLYLFQIGKLPSQLYFSTLYGLVFSCLLYPIVCHFISIRSKAIQFVAKYSKDSLLSTISIGLFLGFFAAFFITLLMCVLIKMGFRISGNKVHVFGDFYHIGIMALSFLVGSLSIFIDSFSKPIIDNAIGISEMLGFKEAKKQQLHTLHAHYNVGMCYFHIATIITVSLTVFLYLVLFLINALTSPKIASLLHANNATQGFNLSLFKHIDLTSLIHIFEIHFLNTNFIMGIILGLAFLIGSITLVMWGVSTAYKKINQLIQQELADNPAIWTGEECPDYLKGVSSIATFSNKFMMVSFVSIILFSVSTWFLVGIAGTIGFLIGLLTGGCILSLFFIVSGYTWANTKLLVENDPTLKGHPEHVSVIVSDKLGDLFKDAIAPIIVDSMKLIILVSILLISLIINMDNVISL